MTRADDALQQGFTLVEMMVVLLIVALASASVMPLLGNRSRASESETTAKELQMLLFDARTRAIAQRSTATVDFDLDIGTVTDRQSGRSTRLAAELNPKLLLGRELLASNGGAQLLFFADGGSTGARIILSASETYGSSVIVPWLTGVPVIVRNQE